MAMDIKAMLLKKQQDRMKNKSLVFQDVNRPLVLALLGISVYGKDARDEDIMSIIINGTTDVHDDDIVDQIKTNHDKLVKGKQLKKGKDGMYRNKEGFIILTPRS